MIVEPHFSIMHTALEMGILSLFYFFLAGGANRNYNLFPDVPLEFGCGRGIGGADGADTFLDGIIDDVIIWDRALSEDEVKELGEKERRPNRALSVKAHGKLSTTWGKVKSYNTQLR